MFREMRRINQQLSAERVAEVLASAPRGVLSVIGDDGYPYGMPLNYVYDPTCGEHGSLFFHSALKGHKVDAITACDKVSFCLMDEGTQNEGEWWLYFDSVICFGRIFVVEDEQRRHDALFKLASKYFPPEVDIEADIAKGSSRVLTLELRIEHVTGKHVQEK